jgi:hypothetical protein
MWLPFLIIYFIPYILGAQMVDSYLKENKPLDSFHSGIQMLREFIAIPNLGSNKEHIQKNLSWCQKVFTELNFKTKILTTKEVPVLFAEKKSPNPSAKTILFYLQIDGQPFDPSEWSQENPFIPVIKKLHGITELRDSKKSAEFIHNKIAIEFRNSADNFKFRNSADFFKIPE